jgi:nicotinamide-nucleotide amidase
LVPRGAQILENETGTAPGVLIQKKKTLFAFLPGPPTECRPIVLRDLIPIARERVGGKRLYRREFWRSFGRGESEIYQRVAPLVKNLEKRFPLSVSFGVHISFPCIDLTWEVWDTGEARPGDEEIDRVVKQITEALGPLCFTRRRESLAETVFQLLQKNQRKLATAESCTGGLIGKLLTDIPGSSEVFLGGAVSYANEAKEILLGVPHETLETHGAVSEETVRAMAQGIRERLRADFGLAVSGIAGPAGGTKEKPVGLVYVGISGEQGTKIVHQVILNGQGNRDQIRVIAAHLALDALRREILVSHGSEIPVH